MKLLLDEHYSPVIARQLRSRGYDVIAVAEIVELRELSDVDLLRWAQREVRVLVTEDVADFTVLHAQYLARGELHTGIVFTSSRSHSRDIRAVGPLLAALADFIDQRPGVSLLEGEIIWP